uniref:Uncharacterized protein n=1 Tax=Meloidogyne enterolobii TaxID=390850 RepID=A0A6V7UU94_MELEN|nr:unnamed protein product [Meloidogyne enterolobii]
MMAHSSFCFILLAHLRLWRIFLFILHCRIDVNLPKNIVGGREAFSAAGKNRPISRAVILPSAFPTSFYFLRFFPFLHLIFRAFLA